MVFGLLFLPAAGHIASDGLGAVNSFARYWSLSAYSSNVDNAFCIYFAALTTQRSGNFARFRGQAIRLASRSELFGCSVDGVGVSVPARCLPLLVEFQ